MKLKLKNNKIINSYIFIAILGIVVLLVIIIGFKTTRPPVVKRDLKLDRLRLSDFELIKSLIQDYYQQEKKLPSNLKELEQRYLQEEYQFIDPLTQKEYEFIKTANEGYKLCTQFATNQDSGENKHQKGYDCIEYSLLP